MLSYGEFALFEFHKATLLQPLRRSTAGQSILLRYGTACCAQWSQQLLGCGTRSPLYLIGDAPSRRGLSRVGYFTPLNGPLNGHPPSYYYAAIERINNLLLATYWSPLQQLHINDQFDFVNTKLLEYINICAPMKVVKIPAKYIIREKWMTKGLLQSSLNFQKNEKRGDW